ncbi:hypothetical protein [Bacillus toyonensis]|uniref:hypothetical protein n=1 Tax=Bacillus toyonensis TaxID=155322 RepID=UPI001C0C6866|nr:hypothetical protein [Bacillus toyonensis]MBU4643227.1 hypothetical protein [Bacillus toyonensis]
MEKYFYYRNFKMGIELDIAGTFIYDGINGLKSMEDFKVESEIFSFLYHISVGIERIQKIIIVLIEEIRDIKKFEESLKTHSHKGLHERIRQQRKVDFNSRQYDFLDLISNFYNSGRYNNYLVNSEIERDVIDVNIFLSKYAGINPEQVSYSISELDKCKEMFGRVIGSIVKSYYNVIQEICNEKNIYTDEIRYDSKAFRIFPPKYYKNSLNTINKEEVIAMKELLIYLANSEDNNGFVDFFRSIEPLGFDVEDIQNYLCSIVIGKIPRALICAVEDLYYEEDVKNRLEQLSVLGNKYVEFYGE